jgi:hypothetical protein
MNPEPPPGMTRRNRRKRKKPPPPWVQTQQQEIKKHPRRRAIVPRPIYQMTWLLSQRKKDGKYYANVWVHGDVRARKEHTAIPLEGESPDKLMAQVGGHSGDTYQARPESGG